jgi:hypothetical protein
MLLNDIVGEIVVSHSNLYTAPVLKVNAIFVITYKNKVIKNGLLIPGCG